MSNDVPGASGEHTHTRRDFLKRAGTAGLLLAGSGAYAGLGARVAGARNVRNAQARINGTISVRYWGQGQERVSWQKRIAYFESKYPNVTVKQQLLEKNGYEEFPNLLTQIAGGNAPDVMRVLNYQPTQLVEQGNALMALDQFVAADPTLDKADFVPTDWNSGKVNGKQYAIPQNGEPYGLFYNADLFKKAGIPDPWTQYKAGTWNQDSFRKAAETIQKSAGIKYGAAFESWNYDVFIFMGGGSVLGPGGTSVTIDSPKNAKTLQFFADMVKNGTSPDTQVASGTYLPFFQQGQVAMYLSGAWWVHYVGKVPFKWQQAPLPKFWGTLGTKVEIDAVSMSSQTKNPDAAWAFLKTVTDKRGETIWTASATPTRISVLKSPVFTSNPYTKPVELMLEHSHFTPFVKAGAGVDTAATAALSSMWLGKQTAAQALADAKSKLQQVIA